MPFFLLALLFFCLAQLADSQEDLVIPLTCNVHYYNTGGMSLGNSCTEHEIEAVDAMLESMLSEKLVALQHMIGLEEQLQDAENHIPCESQQCMGTFHLLFLNAVQTDQENLVEVRDHLDTVCHSVLAGFADNIMESIECRNYLETSLCEVMFTISAV
jgi:hypothetical protein